MLFDRYLVVDWSASSVPKRGKDSVWICTLSADGVPSTQNPATRRAAEGIVREALLQAVRQRERVLVGFDFPYSYPAGFASALGLGGPPWSAIWGYLTERVEDDARNANNRFNVAAEINARLQPPVFWGCPQSKPLEHLSPKKDQVIYRGEQHARGLRESREVEALLLSRRHRPQATWKLTGNGSVGSQSLTGIPVLSRLRHDPVLAPASTVWPFETVVPSIPEGRPAVVHAEIWPSLMTVPAVEGRVKDESQVMFLAEEYRARDRGGTLGDLFAAASTHAAREEGWILGVEQSDKHPFEPHGVAPMARLGL